MKKIISKISVVTSILTTVYSISLNKSQYDNHTEINHTHLKHTESNFKDEVHDLSNKEERQKNQRVKRAKGEDNTISPYGIVTPPIDPSDPDDGGYFTDNEPDDNSFSSATEIDLTKYNRIRADLNSSKDKDYYRFSFDKKTSLVINWKLNANYLLKLSTYIKPNEVIEPEITTYPDSSAYKDIITYSYGLYPGTYFLGVYQAQDNLTYTPYDFDLHISNIQNKKNFHLTRGNKENYGLVLWKNELNPEVLPMYENEPALFCIGFPGSECSSNRTPIDPINIFETSGTTIIQKQRSSEKKLDSILYVWGEDFIKDFYATLKFMKLAYETEKDNHNKIIEIVKKGAEVIFNVIGLLSTQNKKISLVLSATSLVFSVLDFVCILLKGEDTIKEEEMQSLWFQALIDLLGVIDKDIEEGVNYSNSVIEIKKFYKLSTFTYNPLIFYCEGSKETSYFYEINENTESKDFKYNDELIYAEQTIGENELKQNGDIIAFKNLIEYKEYQSNGKINEHNINYHTSNEEIKSTNLGVNVNTHFDFYNDKYHAIYCALCDEQFLIGHVFEKHNNIYTCIYCYYEKLDLQSSTIDANAMPFPQIYNLDPIEQDVVDSRGNTIKTKRLRTGMIEGYLTMSSISNDADKAYIEYHFDKPVVSFSFYAGLWGPKEWFPTNTYLSVEYYDLNSGGWEEFNKKYIIDLSNDRNVLGHYQDKVIPYSTYAIRFIIEAEKNPDSDWNRGRVVLGDIQFTYLV